MSSGGRVAAAFFKSDGDDMIQPFYRNPQGSKKIAGQAVVSNQSGLRKRRPLFSCKGSAGVPPAEFGDTPNAILLDADTIKPP